jgi:hypothetical protein
VGMSTDPLREADDSESDRQANRRDPHASC